MGSRSYAQVAPNPDTIALNAYIFMYGGHSLVTPHAALKQLWWTDERIGAKINRAFVLSKLRGQEREFLDRPLAFGEGLTDDTYLDWVLDRAKRLFLILVEIGVPDQIFGCIDNSWTDDDLPLPMQNVRDLELAYTNDEALNEKFYHAQFVFLLRQLEQGAHIEYGPKEHIPMEYVNTWPPAVTLQVYDRVHFPEQPDTVFMRRKFSLIDKDTAKSQQAQFMHDVHRGKALSHEHIANVWASYTSEDAGYTMSDFVPEHTLTTFMEHRTPPQFMRVSIMHRKSMLCEWMHCLADALAFLHDRGVAHTAVRPSQIWIDPNNRIAFADVGCIKTFQRGKKSPKTETYDYAPPEWQPGKSFSSPTSSPTSPHVCTFDAAPGSRHSSTGSASADGPDSGGAGNSTRGNSFCSVCRTESTNSPVTPITPITPITPVTPDPSQSSIFESPSTQQVKNFSRVTPAVQPTPTTISTTPNDFLRLSLQPSSTHSPEITADIFSLGCIYLDIITFLLKGKITDFIKFRSTPVAQSPKSSSPSAAAWSGDVKGDTSFHASLVCEPHKLSSWLTILRVDAARQSTQLHQSFLASTSSSGSSRAKKANKHSSHPSITTPAGTATAPHLEHATGMHLFHSIPALLALVERMLALDPAARPSALDVRDTLSMILQGGHVDGLMGPASSAARKLCCEGREWSQLPLDDGGFAFGLEKQNDSKGEDDDDDEDGDEENGDGGDRKAPVEADDAAAPLKPTEKNAGKPMARGCQVSAAATATGARPIERSMVGATPRTGLASNGAEARDGEPCAGAENIAAARMKGKLDAAATTTTTTMPGGQRNRISSWKRAFVKVR